MALASESLTRLGVLTRSRQRRPPKLYHSQSFLECSKVYASVRFTWTFDLNFVVESGGYTVLVIKLDVALALPVASLDRDRTRPRRISFYILLYNTTTLHQVRHHHHHPSLRGLFRHPYTTPVVFFFWKSLVVQR